MLCCYKMPFLFFITAVGVCFKAVCLVVSLYFWQMGGDLWDCMPYMLRNRGVPICQKLKVCYSYCRISSADVGGGGGGGTLPRIYPPGGRANTAPRQLSAWARERGATERTTRKTSDRNPPNERRESNNPKQRERNRRQEEQHEAEHQRHPKTRHERIVSKPRSNKKKGEPAVHDLAAPACTVRLWLLMALQETVWRNQD
jgi:hypothetical protein